MTTNEIPTCKVCGEKMDYVEDIERNGVKLKTFTCFKDKQFKLRKA